MNVSCDCKDVESQQRKGANSVFGVSLNLINTMIGAGILAVPGMLRDAALFPGLIMLTGMGIMLGFSAYVLGLTCDDSGEEGSWDRLFEYYFGREWGWITETLQVIFVYGATVSYGVLLKTFLRKLFNTWLEGSIVANLKDDLKRTIPWTNLVIVGITTAFLIGISMIHKDNLQFTSFIGIMAVTGTCVVIIYDYFQPGADPAPTPIDYWVSTSPHHKGVLSGVVKGMCISGFAFATHFNVPMVYGQLIDRSPKRFSYSVIFSFLACIMIYDVIGVVGYMRLGREMKKGEYILNFPSNYNWTMYVIRVGMFLSIFTGFPLYINPLRITLNSLFVRLGLIRKEPTKWDASQKLMTVVLVVCATLPGLFELEMEDIIGFATAVSGSWIILGLPGIMGWKMTQGKERPTIRVLSLALFITGALLCFFGIIDSFGIIGKKDTVATE